MQVMKKDIKNNELKGVRVLLPPVLYGNLEREAQNESRKLSAMMRRILEERYETINPFKE